MPCSKQYVSVCAVTDWNAIDVHLLGIDIVPCNVGSAMDTRNLEKRCHGSFVDGHERVEGLDVKRTWKYGLAKIEKEHTEERTIVVHPSSAPVCPF